MKKVVLIALISVFTLPLAAHAQNCELPHERLQHRCGGESPDYVALSDENPNAVSAVGKPSDADAKRVVDSYREVSRKSADAVEKAVEDYRAYLAKRALTSQN